MVISANLGFPRIGPDRELKKAVEAFWAGKISGEDLLATCDFAANTPASEFWALPYLQRALDAYYQSERFRHYSNVIPRAKLDWGGVQDLLDSDPCIVAALRANASLRRIFHPVLKGRAEASCASMPESRNQP